MTLHLTPRVALCLILTVLAYGIWQDDKTRRSVLTSAQSVVEGVNARIQDKVDQIRRKHFNGKS